MRSAVKRNMVMQYGFVAARYIFPFLTLPFLARVLGPDSYAARAYIVSFMLFVQTFADYGFNLSGSRMIVLNRDDSDKCSSVTVSILLAKVVVLCLLGVAVAAACLFIPLLNSNLPCVVVAYLGLCLGTLIPDFLFMGFEEMGVITARFVISKTVSTVLILLFVRSPEDILLPFVFDAAGSLLSFVLSWVPVLKRYGLVFQVPRTRDALAALKDATPFFLSNVSVAALNSLSTILIGIYSTSNLDVACWSLTITALNAILSLYNPIANALYPHMVHSQDFGMFRKFLFGGSALALFGAILFAVLAPLIIWVLGGAEYVAGAWMLRWVSPVIAFAFPALLLGSPLLGALGHTKELSCTSIFAALVLCLELLLAVIGGFFSVAAVAFCRCVAEFALFGSRALVARKVVDGTFRQ